MKKLLLIFFGLLSAHFAGAQSCNLINVTWAHTPQPGDPYNVTFTNNTPTTIAGTYDLSLVLYTPTYQIIPLTTTYSHSFSSSGVQVAGASLYIYDPATNAMICGDSIGLNITLAPNTLCAATINTVDNGNGSYTFTAVPSGSSTGLTFNWDLGDGSAPATGSSVTHSFANSGSYTVTLNTLGGGVSCTDTANINYFSGALNCSALSNGFNYTVGGTTVNFMGGYTPVNIPGAPIGMSFLWDLGNGSTSTLQNPVVTYNSYGNYNVSLITQWVNTNTQALLCTHTYNMTVPVVPPPNIIEGSITWSSSVGIPTSMFKVWLVTFDPTTNIIDAIDSTTVSGNVTSTQFSFYNAPAGDYRIKAAVVSGMPGGSVLAPTYHNASTYWGTANVINHTGGMSSNNNITMQAGSATSGPGFIAGNVTQGAGKGTGAGVPNLLILLRDATNHIVKFTYTDADGDYSFINLPIGTYNIYPENMPQVTTPSGTINITATQHSVTGIDFEKKSTTIIPKTTIVPEPGADFFSIYPNPATGTVTLYWSNHAAEQVNITVTDMTGREVLQKPTNTNNPVHLNLEHAAAGVYFIKVAGDRTQCTQKIIVQH